MKKILPFLIIALLPAPAMAQTWPQTLGLLRDTTVTAANYDYCTTESSLHPIQGALSDVAASNTLASADAIFTDVAAGDVVTIYAVGTAPYSRAISSVAGNKKSIVVAGAVITYTGATTSLQYRKTSCGTAVTNGWIDVSNCEGGTIQVDIIALGSAAITFRAEGKIAGATTGATLFTTAAYVAAASYTYEVTETALDALRVGQQITAADGVDSVTILFNCNKRK